MAHLYKQKNGGVHINAEGIFFFRSIDTAHRSLFLSLRCALVTKTRTMARRAAMTVAKALAPCSEMTSVGASIIGTTRDGRLAQVSLTAVYEHRGRAAVGLAYEDQLAQAFFEAARRPPRRRMARTNRRSHATRGGHAVRASVLPWHPCAQSLVSIH
ncbi:hypothetical protein TW95_gp0192 [Pandoravirus inopinatum]|uniref:Uncharacterized protein n=1 Tax=Pandoravirus inopinatum TaxID=1605721 RepID=A0A0B5J812_9VIRU|nr:hypothetical protein TW95_gp0192 [Pandoravirus inopinatum]AJF96926.1 hypothetical protein [Pandoravirus inopinatum]